VSGNVSSESDSPTVTIVIFNPDRSNFVTLSSAIANSDGFFTTDIRVGGPTWSGFGIYPIKITSEGHSLEKSIEYQESFDVFEEEYVEPESTPEPETTSEPESIPEPSFFTLKFSIPNFPSLDKSPQYYLDRYDNESTYKSWVDSQFPNTSIYNVLGYSNPVSVPDWIQNNAQWWATGDITDSVFLDGIEYMIENKIIMISNVTPNEIQNNQIPNWIRNNAHWWSQDLISEKEFVSSLEFLISEGIISVN